MGKGFDVGKKRTKFRELVFQIMVGQKNKKIAPESLYLKLGSGAMSTNTKLELDTPETLFEKYVTDGNPRSWSRWQMILKK